MIKLGPDSVKNFKERMIENFFVQKDILEMFKQNSHRAVVQEGESSGDEDDEGSIDSEERKKREAKKEKEMLFKMR